MYKIIDLLNFIFVSYCTVNGTDVSLAGNNKRCFSPNNNKKPTKNIGCFDKMCVYMFIYEDLIKLLLSRNVEIFCDSVHGSIDKTPIIKQLQKYNYYSK